MKSLILLFFISLTAWSMENPFHMDNMLNAMNRDWQEPIPTNSPVILLYPPHQCKLYGGKVSCFSTYEFFKLDFCPKLDDIARQQMNELRQQR